MKTKNHVLTLLTVAIALFTSCEKVQFEEDRHVAEGNSLLTVTTRASDTESPDAKVSYPVYVYVMNADGDCVAVQAIESEDDPISLKLADGTYQVYAVAGADATVYDIPTKENVTATSPIELKAEKSHTDLMTASNSVVMAEGEENQLTLSLERKVMQIEDVTITNIPSSVQAVSITLSPLYEKLQVNGEYVGKNASAAINLEKQDDGSTWKYSGGMFLLGAADVNATVKVSLTYKDGNTKSYSGQSNGKLTANHKIRIEGTYVSEQIQLTGHIIGATWGETETIEITLGKSSGGGEESPTPPVNGNVPAVGTLYKGCRVIRSETNGNGTTVTVVSPDYKNALEFSTNAQLESEINKILESWTEKNNIEWRLPTYEEMAFVQKNLATINGYDVPSLFATGSGNSFFYRSDDSSIKAFKPSTKENSPGSTIGIVSGGKSYKLRGFATITFTE